MSDALFQPIRLGRHTLAHRIAMAPLTRSRAGQPGNVPTPMNVEYYRQRSGAALIVTEATQISQQGQGYAWTPGIHSPGQIDGWRAVSEAVHAEGGKIFLQLWHVGRVSHPVFQPGAGLPVAPTAMPVPGKTFIVDSKGNGAWADVPVPQALTLEGIAQIVQDFRVAARHAMQAGMDGVEIHAGNGYLIDQFINSESNRRTDAYGGSIENRARLLFEVVDAVSAEVGAVNVGVRLTPMGRFMGMGDDTPEATFGHIAEHLDGRNLAYLHLVEPAIVGTVKDEKYDPRWDAIIKLMRRRFNGVLMLAGGYTLETAIQAIESGRADLIAFGRPFIANPDLPARLRAALPLNEADPSTFFGGDARGYIDYPAFAAASD
ncbi:alkene reductase [Paraburkholderia silvatlantica]|uniref:N-ethylmaleimide reductase n=1 Tax=Paraburkholderia silvatlantica TaxID=321895 RepID=A0A2U1A7A3_9BURK|nr:alkene reductase [Paraburkholderia silvatlantica]MBB2931396.1 N-ethylmaleimide reductase [Paraburkholderia silvatlantica]PVY27937.1 N-ethylmaleimide reductase [Paraburkholderia silvatlantica]PXW34784.1 N-ethylmaleimide reductase [Paraburkholderia silvatlantica]PYE20484.1 N-ethylmaleimide reductase [Paraburkholderia silvatlantica]TDQ98650.1 N-ethylmaleimide reductase [Paraburkholderia silvatlantica]